MIIVSRILQKLIRTKTWIKARIKITAAILTIIITAVIMITIQPVVAVAGPLPKLMLL